MVMTVRFRPRAPTYMLIKNSTKVKCEGCGTLLPISGDLDKLADELINAGWGWLRGDEAYDHYCGAKCKKKIGKESVTV